MYKYTLTTNKKMFKIEHSDTSMNINNLIEMLRYQDKYKEIKSMHKQTLTINEKMLDEKHFFTLTNKQFN